MAGYFVIVEKKAAKKIPLFLSARIGAMGWACSQTLCEAQSSGCQYVGVDRLGGGLPIRGEIGRV